MKNPDVSNENKIQQKWRDADVFGQYVYDISALPMMAVDALTSH